MSSQANIDDLLDAALSDFGPPQPAAVPHAVSSSDPSTTTAYAGSGAAQAALSPQPATAQHAAANAENGGGNQQPQTRFDPLKRRTAKAASNNQPAHSAVHTAAAAQSSTTAPHEMLDDAEVEKLRLGLEQMLSELASVASTSDTQRGDAARDTTQHASTAAAAGAAQAGLPHDSGAHATHADADTLAALRALQQGEGGDAAAAAIGGMDEELLRHFTSRLDDLGSSGGMQSLVDSIMHQLVAKDVLYQPMKEIGARYPAWLQANKDKISEAEYARYVKQYAHVQEMCRLYESEPDNYARIMEVMQEMQSCGQPPQGIVDDLAPGLEFDEHGLPKLAEELSNAAGKSMPEMPASCPMQ